MSRDSRALGSDLLRFPRVSGDEPGASILDWVGAAFSPRERG